MALSIGRTLYNLKGRRDAGEEAPRPARPTGEVVWLHAPNGAVLPSVLRLAHRLQEDLGTTIVVTCPVPPADTLPPAVIYQPEPQDTPADAKAFLDHWQPQAIAFAEGEIRPAIIMEAAERGVPQLMIEARTPYLVKSREGWFPGLLRTALQQFGAVMAVDETAARALRKAGAAAPVVLGRMEEQSAALPYHEAERASLAQLLNTRPVWFAAMVPDGEEAAVIAAHRAAMRLAHRVLLILVPADPSRASALAPQLETQEGWIVAQRDHEEEPDAETEVYIVEGTAEFGLWYRLAPVTFMGGSLLGEGCLCNPMEPAALGSAILYGPRAGRYGTAFGRLGAALAARAIGSSGDLTEALADLLSPDRAAKLAHAAWGVASEGVEATDHVVDHIRRLLDGEP